MTTTMPGVQGRGLPEASTMRNSPKKLMLEGVALPHACGELCSFSIHAEKPLACRLSAKS